MTPEEQAAKVEECFALAEAFAAKFPNKHVPCARYGAGAMAAHHDKDTGWGFTAKFIVNPDAVVHMHVWSEFVGKPDDADQVAAEIGKIISA